MLYELFLENVPLAGTLLDLLLLLAVYKIYNFVSSVWSLYGMVKSRTQSLNVNANNTMNKEELEKTVKEVINIVGEFAPIILPIVLPVVQQISEAFEQRNNVKAIENIPKVEENVVETPIVTEVKPFVDTID